MLGVGTLRDPRFSKKHDFLSFVCQMLPRMADHDTYLNVFSKILYIEILVGNHVFGIILSTKISLVNAKNQQILKMQTKCNLPCYERVPTGSH